MGDVVSIRPRAPLRVRIFEDVFGDFSVEMPVTGQPKAYAYDHFPTAEAAREAGKRIARRNFMLLVDETLPDLGGEA
jgi:hypothetical protein